MSRPELIHQQESPEDIEAYQEGLRNVGLISLVGPVEPEETGEPVNAWRALVIPEIVHFMKLIEINTPREVDSEKLKKILWGKALEEFKPFKPFEELDWKLIGDDPGIRYGVSALDALHGAVKYCFESYEDAAA